MTALDRLRDLLIKADPGSVEVHEFEIGKASIRLGETKFRFHWFDVPVAEFAQLKTEFPNVWKEKI